MRATDRAGVGLRVEAAVERVVVLALAGRALREARHAGVRPVVGQRAGDREARPAVRAVDERVAMTAVGRIEQLVEAGGAHRGVGRDAGAHHAVPALDDAETRRRRLRDRRRLDLRDARQRRRLAAQPLDQRGDRSLRAGHIDLHAIAVVEHAAIELQLGRQPVDERPEAHALHQSAHADATGLRRAAGNDGAVHDGLEVSDSGAARRSHGGWKQLTGYPLSAARRYVLRAAPAAGRPARSVRRAARRRRSRPRAASRATRPCRCRAWPTPAAPRSTG